MTREDEEKILNICGKNNARIDDSISCYFILDCEMFLSIDVEAQTIELCNDYVDEGGMKINKEFSIKSIAEVYECLFCKEFILK